MEFLSDSEDIYDDLWSDHILLFCSLTGFNPGTDGTCPGLASALGQYSHFTISCLGHDQLIPARPAPSIVCL